MQAVRRIDWSPNHLDPYNLKCLGLNLSFSADTGIHLFFRCILALWKQREQAAAFCLFFKLLPLGVDTGSAASRQGQGARDECVQPTPDAFLCSLQTVGTNDTASGRPPACLWGPQLNPEFRCAHKSAEYPLCLSDGQSLSRRSRLVVQQRGAGTTACCWYNSVLLHFTT